MEAITLSVLFFIIIYKLQFFCCSVVKNDQAPFIIFLKSSLFEIVYIN